MLQDGHNGAIRALLDTRVLQTTHCGTPGLQRLQTRAFWTFPSAALPHLAHRVRVVALFPHRTHSCATFLMFADILNFLLFKLPVLHVHLLP